VITGIVLAAGTSSRFGRTKQVVDVRGKPLVQHAVDAAADAGLDEVIVVLGHEGERVRDSLRLPASARTVTNPDYREGQASSLIAGLDAADPRSYAAVVLLADQPGITADHVRTLAARFRPERSRILRLRFRDGPGPAMLSRDVWGEAHGLAGDTGAREILQSHPDWVEEVPVDENAPADVDEPGDLELMP
jgi:molybdenum cofactor cytidylyltransferase